MPWSTDSGRTYLLALFDTNALSEIVKHPEREGAGFRRLLSSQNVAPCITTYSLAELHAGGALFDEFLDTFSRIPIFLTKPWEMILDEELDIYDTDDIASPLLCAFSPLGEDPSYKLRLVVNQVLKNPVTRRRIARGEAERTAAEITDAWQQSAEKFKRTQSAPNAKDADRYVEEAGLQTLITLRPDWAAALIHNGGVPDVHRVPTVAVMLYSQYWRVFHPNWDEDVSDVRDLEIMAVSPYMDIVVTERRQAEIFRKIGDRVTGIGDLEVMRLEDLRGR